MYVWGICISGKVKTSILDISRVIQIYIYIQSSTPEFVFSLLFSKNLIHI